MPKIFPFNDDTSLGFGFNVGYRTLLRYWRRTVSRKSSIGVLYVCVVGPDIVKFDKNSTDLNCFMFQFEGLGALFGDLSPPKAPGLYW